MKSPFEGDSIILRPVEPGDVPGLQAILNHPGLAGRRHIPWRFPEIAPLSREQVEAIVQSWNRDERAFHMAVERKGNDGLIGVAECDWGWDPHCPSVAVVIAPDSQRQGYGSEALNLLLEYLFGNTPAHSIGCWTAEWNEPALRFAERHRFRLNGRMRRAGIREGRYFDVLVADILRPEWLEFGGKHCAA